MNTISSSRIAHAWECVAVLLRRHLQEPQRVPWRVVAAAQDYALELEREEAA